jgi:PadR family transcriptional regulator PadR
MGVDKTKTDFFPGTLDMLVLKIFLRGDLHGYAIAQLIQQLSDDLLRVEEGSLYPALQRLELNGWIEGEWGLSANSRRARFYKLTPDGRKHLIEESARYRKVTGALARITGFAQRSAMKATLSWNRYRRRLRYWLDQGETAQDFAAQGMPEEEHVSQLEGGLAV